MEKGSSACPCQFLIINIKWIQPLRLFVFNPLITHFLPTFLIRTRPSFPHSQPLPSRRFHKLLILVLHRADRMKTTITENQSNWSHRPQPCLTQWNYKPCFVEPPKMDGSWWRVLTKCGPLAKRMANHFSILALRTPWQYEKAKRLDTERWTSQVSRWPICSWRRVKK